MGTLVGRFKGCALSMAYTKRVKAIFTQRILA